MRYRSFLLALILVCVGLQPAEAVDTCTVVVNATWPKALRSRAIRIARCESRCKSKAKNPRSSATGIFQIINATWSDYSRNDEVRTDPYDNAAVAYRIYKGQGWNAWVCK